MTFRKNKTAWLPEYPKHWKVMRIKNLFSEMDERSETGSEELLSVSQYTGVTPKKASLENDDDHITNAESLVGYKVVSKNDLVINIMLAWNGSLGISPYDGIVSPAYCVYRCLPGNNPEYFGYLFSTELFKGEFRRNSTGIIDSRLRLYSDKFFSIFSVVPPKEEQDNIVNYIKAQEQKIRGFIQKKKTFIDLLNEQKQNVISEAVTFGLDRSIELKSTGIEWLEKIPKHWIVCRIKNVSSIISKGTTPTTMGEDTLEEGPIRFLKGENIIENRLSSTPSFFISEETNDLLFRSKLELNDVLIVIAGATIGKTAIVTSDFLPSNTNQAVCFIRPKNVLPEFLWLWLQSSYVSKKIWLEANQAAQPNLGMAKIATFYIPLPPIKEQEAILEYIKQETTTINTAISKANKEIDLIKEYKECMIAEAVTGKINLSSKKQLPKYIQEDLPVSMAAEV